MEDKKYEEFFQEIKEFLEKKKEQGRRGINEYNIISVLRKKDEEVGLHSKMIYSLLNPNGEHNQGDLFLQLFVDKIIKPKIGCQEFGNSLLVAREEHTEENRRIDFTIKSSLYLVGIEMKINALDLDNQLFDYCKDLKIKANGTKKEVIIFYLTKDGKKANPNSTNNCNECKIINISFEEDILIWLEASKKEIENIMNLNEAIKSYIEIVKQITNKYESKGIKMKDFILNDEKNYEYATAIYKDYEEVRKENIKLFIKRLEKELENNNINFIKNKDYTDKVLIKLLDLENNYFYGLQIIFEGDNLKLSIFKKKDDENDWQEIDFINKNKDFKKVKNHYEHNYSSISSKKLLKNIELDDLINFIDNTIKKIPRKIKCPTKQP